jgi:hypothetical protein
VKLYRAFVPHEVDFGPSFSTFVQEGEALEFRGERYVESHGNLLDDKGWHESPAEALKAASEAYRRCSVRMLQEACRLEAQAEEAVSVIDKQPTSEGVR